MKLKKFMYIVQHIIIIILIAGCSKDLIKDPLVMSRDRWDMTCVMLTLGPDQYNTAGGYWEPRPGKKFVWATIKLRNRLKTDQQFNLDRIFLSTGRKQVKPFILDMDFAVSLRANPAPKLKPDETISRKLIYIVPRGAVPEKIMYENVDLIIPAPKTR